jgi:hypothetical protein
MRIWCLLDGSWALDPLNAFAVAGPVMSAHDAAAAQMEQGHGGLYALVWGEPTLPERSTAVWLTRPRGIQWRTSLDTTPPIKRAWAGRGLLSRKTKHLVLFLCHEVVGPQWQL